MTNSSHLGLISDWLDEKTVKRFKLTAMNYSLIDAWSAEAITLLEQQPDDQPYRVIHDLSTQAVGLLFSSQMGFDLLNPGVTPKGQTRAIEIMSSRPQLIVKLAVIVSEFQSGQFVYQRAGRKTSTIPNLTAQLFFDQEAALEWLKKSDSTDTSGKLVFDNPFS